MIGGRSQRPIRVLHVVLSLDIGGLENVVLNLVRNTNRSEFEPRVMCLRHRGELAPRFEKLDIPVEALDAGGRASGLWSFTRRLSRLRPDILHSHNPTPHQFAAFARLLGRVPALVHTKHGRNYPHLRRAVLLNRWAARFSNVVVAVSEDAAAVARDIERVPNRKLQVVYNGIETRRFQRRPASEGGVNRRGISVARLDPVKDQETLLRAVRAAVDAIPGFQLELVGDGPERARVERLRAELRLESHVRLLGFRDDVAALLQGASVFVLSSLSEGISLTLLEAMACGLPVVATDVGGNREVVAHGETGLLVPPRSPQALAEGILFLTREPVRAAAMGAAGRRRVEAMFDVDGMVSRYEALYRNALGPGSTGSPAAQPC